MRLVFRDGQKKVKKMKTRPQTSPYLATLALGATMLLYANPAQANLCDLPARSLTPEQLEAVAQQGCLEDALEGQAARPGAPASSGVPGTSDEAAAATDESGGINVGIGGGATGNTGGINVGVGPGAANDGTGGVNVGVGTEAASGNTGGISVGVGEGAATGNTGGVNADVGGGGTGAGSGNEGGIGVGIGGEGGIGAGINGDGIGVTVGQ